MARDGIEGLGLATSQVERGSLHLQVYRKLCEVISTGELQPGAEITLNSLAELVGTSAMPVRDAVRRLIGERALELRPGRRFGVPRLSADQYREILRIRLLLEAEAARVAAERIADDELVEIKRVQQELVNSDRAGGTRRELWTLNRQFHFGVYEAARLPQLCSMIAGLWLQMGPLFNHLAVDIGTRRAAGYHEMVLSGLERRDGEAAAEAMRNDLLSAAEQILEQLSESGGVAQRIA